MSRLWQQVQFFRPGMLDLIEIAIVAILIYRLLIVIQRTRAIQMLVGVLLLAGTYFLSRLLNLNLIREILEASFQYGAIAALVVFQPELRSALARLGRNRMFRMVNPLHGLHLVDELIEGVEQLARSKTGAIIAIEQEVGLDEYAQTGSPERARVSAHMLNTIFAPSTPLHDGAVLIRGDEIVAAGAILPLTQYALSDKTLGTRHRAAIGLSEETDAIVIVVSEETARVSVAVGGRLERDVDSQRIRELLGGTIPEGARPLAGVSKLG